MSQVADEVSAAQQELVDEFGLFDDWMGRYQHLIDLGRQLPEFPPEWKTDENKIRGCQSQVWIRSEMHGDRLHFDGVSDAAIVSGLIAVLFRVYNDRRPSELLAAKPDFIGEIGFAEHLSPTRSNGLHAMLRAIYAQAQDQVEGEAH